MSSSSPPERLHWPSSVALILGALSIAFAPIFAVIAQAEGSIGPATSAFWRVAIAAALLGGASVARRRPSARGDRAVLPPRRLLLTLAAVGAFFAGDLVTWHWAFHFTQPANATLLANCQVFIVAFVGWRFLGEPVGWSYVVGTLLAIAGTAILLRADFAEESARAWGYLLGAGTAVFYAAYLLSVKRVRGRVTTLTLMTWSSAFCAACLLPFAAGEALASERLVLVPGTLASWGALLGLAVISHCFGQGLIAFSLARLPASFSAVTLLLQPLAVALLQWLILDESLGSGQAAGGALLLVGILLARLSSRPR